MSMAFESAECALGRLLSYAEGGDWGDCCEGIALDLERRFRKRVRLALGLHLFLTTRAGRAGLSLGARSGLLPFQWLHRQLS